MSAVCCGKPNPTAFDPRLTMILEQCKKETRFSLQQLSNMYEK